jgi:hypothetical protein
MRILAAALLVLGCSKQVDDAHGWGTRPRTPIHGQLGFSASTMMDYTITLPQGLLVTQSSNPTHMTYDGHIVGNDGGLDPTVELYLIAEPPPKSLDDAVKRASDEGDDVVRREATADGFFVVALVKRALWTVTVFKRAGQFTVACHGTQGNHYDDAMAGSRALLEDICLTLIFK